MAKKPRNIHIPAHKLSPRVQHRTNMAILSGKVLIHHGGCQFCEMKASHANKTIDGLLYCSGCMYMDADRTLPDKSIPIEEGQTNDFDKYQPAQQR